MSKYRYEVDTQRNGEVFHCDTMVEATEYAKEKSEKQFGPVIIEVYNSKTDEYLPWFYAVTQGVEEIIMQHREAVHGESIGK